MTKDIAVSQRAREFAANACIDRGGQMPDESEARAILSGEYDAIPIVQIAARFEAEIRADERDAIVAWQPIETAPKDGTAIFAMLTGSDLPHTIRFHGGKWLIAWDAYDLSAECDAPTTWMAIPSKEPHRATHAGEVERLREENEALKKRGSELVIVYHVAICSPKGVVPDDRFYDPAIAAKIQSEMDRARQALEASR